MQGKRVEFRSEWAEGEAPKPGDYWQELDGKWSGVAPTGLICNLAKHTVVEHGDGTISVTPSILVWSGKSDERWHGYLTKGVWVTC